MLVGLVCHINTNQFTLSKCLCVSCYQAVNWLLLFGKFYIAVASNSKAVIASLADSVVDLLSQAVQSAATKYMDQYHPDYPVGRSRLEAIAVLASAGIMIMARSGHDSTSLFILICNFLFFGIY